MTLFYPPQKKFLHGPEFIVMHLSLFSGCCDKIPDRGNWSWKGFIVAHSSRFRCIMAEKSGWQEPEATVHVLSVGIDRKEGSNEHIYTGVQFAFPTFIQSSVPCWGNDAAHSVQAFSPQSTKSRKFPIRMPQVPSSGYLCFLSSWQFNTVCHRIQIKFFLIINQKGTYFKIFIWCTYNFTIYYK